MPEDTIKELLELCRVQIDVERARDLNYTSDTARWKLAKKLAYQIWEQLEEEPDLTTIFDLLKCGKHIEAIKEYRDMTGKSLRESRDAVKCIQEEWEL